MEIVRQGEGSGVEKEVMGNMQHQLQLLSQVFCYCITGYKIIQLKCCFWENLTKYWGLFNTPNLSQFVSGIDDSTSLEVNSWTLINGIDMTRLPWCQPIMPELDL